MSQPEFILANKQKFYQDEAVALARTCSRVIVAKGKKALVFELSDASVSDETLASVILGRSGTLRAPALRVNDTFIVGFHAESYEEVFG